MVINLPADSCVLNAVIDEPPLKSAFPLDAVVKAAVLVCPYPRSNTAMAFVLELNTACGFGLGSNIAFPNAVVELTLVKDPVNPLILM